MKKSKYIKPQCEDIFLAKGGSVDENCVTGSVATGAPPLGCKTGDAAIQNCASGPLVVVSTPCDTGTTASPSCEIGDGALSNCVKGDWVGG